MCLRVTVAPCPAPAVWGWVATRISAGIGTALPELAAGAAPRARAAHQGATGSDGRMVGNGQVPATWWLPEMKSIRRNMERIAA